MAEKWLEEMIEKIRVRETELINMKRAANTWFRGEGEEPPYPDADEATAGGPHRMRADLFYGKPFAQAAKTYLQMRKQAVPAEEVVRALEQGGFDFEGAGWKGEDRLRIVSMSMAKNTAQFHRLPSGTYGLPEWYEEAITKKKAAKKDNKDEKEKKDAKDETASE
jgi:hypothetical protein